MSSGPPFLIQSSRRKSFITRALATTKNSWVRAGLLRVETGLDGLWTGGLPDNFRVFGLRDDAFGIFKACQPIRMTTSRETVRLQSLGQELSGILCLPEAKQPVPVVILCHGAGEFKENYLELAEFLGEMGVASFAFDFHGSTSTLCLPASVNPRWIPCHSF